MTLQAELPVLPHGRGMEQCVPAGLQPAEGDTLLPGAHLYAQ